MKKYILLFSLLIVSGCTRLNPLANPGPINTPPSISNLSFSPSSVPIDYGGGACSVYASVDFIDPDADLDKIYLKTQNGVSSTSPGNREKTGVVQIVGVVSTTIAGPYQFEIYVKDKYGNESNHLKGTFTVY